MYQANQSSIKCRKSNSETRAGQYMCPECGEVFDTKKEVDEHIRKNHESHFVNNGVHIH